MTQFRTRRNSSSPRNNEWPEIEVYQQKTLARLYPAGTPMSQVHPDFHGISLHAWRMLKIKEQADELHAVWEKAVAAGVAEEPWLSKQREWRPRDSYGVAGRG